MKHEVAAIISAAECLGAVPDQFRVQTVVGYTFHALWDIIKLISSDLDDIDAGHEDVPIYKNEN